jgi:hypothetical protein
MIQPIQCSYCHGDFKGSETQRYDFRHGDDGRQNIKFDAATHLYTINGRPVPSVTRVLAEMLATETRWYKREDRVRGSRVHSLCAQIARLEHPSSDAEWDGTCDMPEAIPYGLAFTRWTREVGFEVIHAELPLYSESLGVAGSTDLIGIGRKIGGGVILVDTKTGSVPPSVDLQTAAYERLALDSMGLKIDARYSLQLQAGTPRGEFKFRECGSKSDIAVFVGLVQGYLWKQQKGLLNGK